ncbi:glycosyltransferase family 2 protein [Arthrobacter crusticola]|uniref:Glycosyltransferase family 2 protein n=2 Tax=Arthrobacter crusticola TaxID=2547960 RepID=A0A4V3AMV5_9MICC|nr:glycosyltransferase family 2 protein [Arthrobacter crusticola]
MLPDWVEITVVDGSPANCFERHMRALPPRLRVLRPDAFETGNGKVVGVLTGVRAARHERLVLADDDVRYSAEQLREVVNRLDGADLVRPQNYFRELPWHARWDTARSLINRAFGSDYPGTLAVRRSILETTCGYSSEALFENLELIRTVHAAGGREARADDVFVARIPPTARHFLGQRIRQAYDSFAQPGRLAAELAILPLVGYAAGRPRRLVAGIGALVVLTEVGRRRQGGRQVFPPTSALWAPLWALERGVCIWLAVLSRLRGGVPYAGGRMKLAAHSEAWLTRRHAQAHSRRRQGAEAQ